MSAGWLGVRMEWTKLRTLRSTGWLTLGIVGSMAGISALATWAVAAARCPSANGCAGEDTPRLALSGVYIAQIAVALLATSAITTEYDTGTIRVSLTAYPRRLAACVAKASVVVVPALSAAVLGVLGCLAAGRLALPGRRYVEGNAVPPLSLADEPTLRAATGTVLYLLLIAVLGLGVGLIVRHGAAAISTVLSLLFLPALVASLVNNAHLREWLVKYSPMTAGLQIQATKALDALPIGPWRGLGVLALYAFAAWLIGAVLFIARDA